MMEKGMNARGAKKLFCLTRHVNGKAIPIWRLDNIYKTCAYRTHSHIVIKAK